MPVKKAGQSTPSRVRSANWTDDLDKVLLKVLKEQYLLGNCVAGQVKKDAWDEIVPSFNQQTRGSLAKSHLKCRLKILKKAFALYSALASRSGWSWDYFSNTPKPGSSLDWETAISENPKFARCKYRPFQAYNDLEVLYGKGMPIGMLENTPSPEEGSGNKTSPSGTNGNLNEDTPSSSKVPMSILTTLPTSPEFFSVAPAPSHPFCIRTNPNPLDSQTPLVECPNESFETQSGKRQRLDPSAPYLCKMTCTGNKKLLSEFVEIGRQCLDISREFLNREPVARLRVYSLEDCIEKINAMEDLSDEAILIAFEALKDRDNRTIFMSLNGSLSAAWIDRQVKLQSASHSSVDK